MQPYIRQHRICIYFDLICRKRHENGKSQDSRMHPLCGDHHQSSNNNLTTNNYSYDVNSDVH